MVIDEKLGHSSVVDMRVIVGDMQYAISHLGESWFRLQYPCEIPANVNAQLVVMIDDTQFTYDICLPQGASPESLKVGYF